MEFFVRHTFSTFSLYIFLLFAPYSIHDLDISVADAHEGFWHTSFERDTELQFVGMMEECRRWETIKKVSITKNICFDVV